MCGVLNNSNKGVFKAIKTEMEFRFFIIVSYGYCETMAHWMIKTIRRSITAVGVHTSSKVYKHILNIKPHCRVLRTRLS